ncbi:MAG: methyltransferase type 11 [Halioglobus sp.]|mgnify:CR=1 FL=1|nr:methyltransferase type 11 [Halioglobus sp.]|tara:strand:+ start:166 stop:1854 length:1689 start_codon:yes stop_codon:yes gene_type:complete
MKSTRFYDQHADALTLQYNSLETDAVHRQWLSRHLPARPGIACDIGAGSGRDASWLAEKGWDVIAVEPSDAMRALASNTSHPAVTWLNDALPDLHKLRALGHRFDLVLVSAVWMHLPASVRERAFRMLSEMLTPGGILVISLRHGVDAEENKRRGFHQVSGDELEELARCRAVAITDRFEEPDPVRSHVTWETYVFTLPDDGTGALPLLRHIVVNDDKASSYKLGLLRVLTRIAEGAPGAVLRRTSDYVDIPLGLVGLYWIKQYRPLLLVHKIPQHPSTSKGYGFARQDFHQLANISSYDLRIGASFDGEMGAVVTGAIRDACANITAMPVRYITYPGTNRPVFESERKSVRKSRHSLIVTKHYLQGFGTFRIPAQLWQTLGQYACWLEPAILREWSGLTSGWSIAEHQSVPMDVFNWEEGSRDTRIPAGRYGELNEAGVRVPCVWSAQNIKVVQIDHCFPWARWLNNDLWNLLPASATVNASKGDKLPSAVALSDAKNRIQSWWRRAYVESSYGERFFLELSASLPNLVEGERDLEAIYDAMLLQRTRLKADQQLVEWSGP